jgi:hypothetical protein
VSEELLGVALECSSFMHEAWPKVLPLVKRLDAELNSLVMSAGTQFTCFTSTKVQIRTQIEFARYVRRS